MKYKKFEVPELDLLEERVFAEICADKIDDNYKAEVIKIKYKRMRYNSGYVIVIKTTEEEKNKILEGVFMETPIEYIRKSPN